MSTIDVPTLLKPVPGELPCGPNLEYDPLFREMESAAKGTSAGPFETAEKRDEPPDWKKVIRVGRELLGRTKDLRIYTKMARGALAVSDVTQFCDCLTLLCGSLSDFWDSVHPQLDPDDDNDPLMRVNVLSELCDQVATLNLIGHVEVASAKGLGGITLADVEISKGQRRAGDSDDTVNVSPIEAIFEKCDLESLQARAAATRDSIALVGAIENALTEKVGATNACSFEPLVRRLSDLAKALGDGLAVRGIATAAVDAPQLPSDEHPTADSSTDYTQVSAATVGSKRDVIQAIDRILAYYKANEPSSPIPLLLEGAKRLVTMEFLEIMGVVTPEGLKNLKKIAGIPEK